jgi:hypothetical protein
MPIPLPPKARAKAKPAHHHDVDKIESIDWLALWALSIALSAMFMASLVFFGVGDKFGASMILFGAAGVTGLALHLDSLTSDHPPPAD